MKFLDFHSHFRNFSAKETAIVSIFPNECSWENRNDVYFSCGIHPNFIPEDCNVLSQYIHILKKRMETKKFLAIGECGLDRTSKSSIERQIKILNLQIEIACEFRKPIIIHCVRAYGEMLSLKKQYNKLRLPFVIHGFRGSIKLAEQLTEAGFILSFGYKILKDQNKMNVISELKDKIFFLESDEEKYGVIPLYHEIARYLKWDVEELKEKINIWAKSLFNIDF
ncbi:MAG TPA: TatD family hydrolase [Victivallales bacterium]|nr:TatD family hydrolase [Victivallales bacterium]HPO89539.1 TatD family hydrolase [Victivallales bacterium]HRR29019.1 TatD family hydrolase [Victivallales bacterium]HRU00966.1 TatD family hydrolase [Victivallales bacterium]